MENKIIAAGRRLPAATLGAVLLLTTPAFAQSSPAPAPSKSPLTLSGSLRVREEVWDWFKPADSVGHFTNRYAFTGGILRYGATYDTARWDARAELAETFLFGLPKNATAPAPQGALGLGANYRTFNGAENGRLFLKQAYARVKGIAGTGSSLRAGRFEFSEGTETTPPDRNLAWVKKQRVSERLIGPFGWSHVGRSFDGAQLTLNGAGQGNLTAVAAYPTRGVFDLDGGDTITGVRFAYLAGTQAQYGDKARPWEARLFGMLYEDARKGVNKVDNRAAASLTADHDSIRLGNIGAHYLRGGAAGSGRWDALAWGVYQFGDWGKLRQRAYAYALEGGYQFKGAWSPWLRLGYNVGSGDGNAGDGTHATFYPMLNTPRIYARTPFYGESNINDLFAMGIVRPDAKTTARLDYHRLNLASASDLWYAAGGPFEKSGNFGLVGRPNKSGSRNLADFVDLSVDRAINTRAGATLYAGQMLGKEVIKGIYPDKTGLFLYGEMNYTF